MVDAIRPRSGYWEYRDFSGGVNDTFSALTLSPREGPIYRNVNLDRDGAISRRKGAQKHVAAQVGAGLSASVILQFLPTGGAAELLAVFGTRLVKLEGTAWVNLYTTLTAGPIVLARPFKNLLYLNNGVDDPLVYNPQATDPKVYRPGVPKPATALTVNAPVTGALTNGDIYVRVRFVGPTDDSFVGEPDTELGTKITIANGPTGGVKINVPVYPAGPHRVAKRQIERTKVGGGVFYIEGFVENNTATTFDIVMDDRALEGNAIGPDPGTRGLPPKLFPFTIKGNRIIGWDPIEQRVAWSEIDEFGILPESFPAENYVYLELSDASDLPIACENLGNQTVFYCGRSIHAVYVDPGGTGSEDRWGGWDEGESPSVINARCVRQIMRGHIVWTVKGPYYFDGNDFVHIGERIERFSASLNSSLFQSAYVIHRADRKQIKFVLPGPSSQVNNIAAIYHYRRTTMNPNGMPVGHAWTMHDGSAASSGCIIRNASSKVDTELSADYDGYVWHEDVSERDDHTTAGLVEAEFVTAWLDAGDPYFAKYWTDAWLAISSEGADSLTVAWETQFGRGPAGVKVVDLAVDTSLWDQMTWDLSSWAGGETMIVHFPVAQDGVSAWGKFIRFRFSNSAPDKPFTILGLLLKYDRDVDREDGSD